MKITLLLFLLTGSVSLQLCAQTDPLFNQYQFNQSMFNPAYTGTYNVFNGTLISRAQWAGIKGSPQTTTFNASTAFFKDQLGAGLIVINDRIGISNNSDIQANFAYKLTFLHSHLSFGMQAGIVNYRYDYSNLTLETDDQVLTQRQRPNFSKPTIGAGMFYRADKYYLGISIPRLLDVSIQDDVTTNKIYKKQLYLSGGVVIDKFEGIKLKSTVLAMIQDSDRSYVDISASILLAEIIWAGIGTRNFTTYGANVMLELSNKFRIGYYYELPSSSLLGSTFGTNEVMLSADLEILKNHRALRRYF